MEKFVCNQSECGRYVCGFGERVVNIVCIPEFPGVLGEGQCDMEKLLN